MSTLRAIEHLAPRTFRRALLLSGCLYFVSVSALTVLILHYRSGSNCGVAHGPGAVAVSAATTPSTQVGVSHAPDPAQAATPGMSVRSAAYFSFMEKWRDQCIKGPTMTSYETYPGLLKLSENCYGASQALRESLTWNSLELNRSARVVPSMKNGEAVGVKLYAIRPSSLFAGLGFENGDTVSQINGTPIGTLDGAMAAYQDVETSRYARIELVRKGEPLTILILP